MSTEQRSPKVSFSFQHFTESNTFLSGGDQRYGVHAELIVVSMDTEYVGPFSKYWLVMSTKERSIFEAKNSSFFAIPFSPDKFIVENFKCDDTAETTTFYTQQKPSEYQTWKLTQYCIPVVSGMVYGGLTRILSVDDEKVILNRHFRITASAEEVVLVPTILGRFRKCVLDGELVRTAFETYKDYFYEVPTTN